MLQEFPRCGKKMQTNLIPISGRVPVLNLEFAHGRFGFQPIVENLPKGPHESGGLFGGFLRWIFGSQNAKEKSASKHPPENLPAENKNFCARPPRNPPARPNKSACQTSKYTPFFFA